MQRFWELVDRRGPDECWPWLGGIDLPDGYGYFAGFARLKVRAHRFAYELEVGKIGPGRLVLHSCDNPPCVNPAHLRLGSPADNIDDRRVRGRAPRGVNHHSAKLTEDQVREIRRRWTGGEKQTALAERFGITQSSISRIVRGQDWIHVE